MVLNRIQKVCIDWSKPILLDNRANSRNFYTNEGLYVISTRYIRQGKLWERFIYVGETKRGFDIRFNEHLDDRNPSSWTSIRGTKYIRFGRICNTPSFINSIHWFLLTLETSIIQTMKDMDNVRLVNNRQVKRYKIYYDLIIENKGFSLLPHTINTRDLYNSIYEYPDGENIYGRML
jgi:hypothetical protein